MALSDVYQLTHNYLFESKPMNNVFHVLQANPGEDAQKINDSYANSIIDVIRAYQSTGVTNVDLVCFNLDDAEDFHTQVIGNAGLRVVTDSPSFVAPAMRFPSLNRTIRSGQKRWAGSGEGDYTDGVLTGPAVTLLDDIGDALIADWLASADSHVVGNYIVVKRVCEEEEPVTEKCLKYRLPESDAELVFFQPDAFILNTKISSQVSRKTF